MSEYTGSKASVGVYSKDSYMYGRGTRTYINGLEVSEVTQIIIGRVAVIQANFIPSCAGQKAALSAILSLRTVNLTVRCPEVAGGAILYYSGRKIDGRVTFPVNDVIQFQMEVILERDAAEDGPEVEVINGVRTANMIDRIWARIREEEESDRKFEDILRKYFTAEEVVGGFKLVTEPETDGCKFHSAPE